MFPFLFTLCFVVKKKISPGVVIYSRGERDDRGSTMYIVLLDKTLCIRRINISPSSMYLLPPFEPKISGNYAEIGKKIPETTTNNEQKKLII